MLKIGELTSGLFAGDKLIAGKEFDIKQLVDNITFADDLVHEEINTQLVLICNLSSIPIYLYRDSVRTEIKKNNISNGIHLEYLLLLVFLMKIILQ